MTKKSVDVAPEMRGSDAGVGATEQTDLSPWEKSGVKIDGEVMKLVGRSNVVREGKGWRVRWPWANSC